MISSQLPTLREFEHFAWFAELGVSFQEASADVVISIKVDIYYGHNHGT